MTKSSIEWTHKTWNPVTGCTKVSQGCKHCYAEREWTRLCKNPKAIQFGRAFTDVQCHPERLTAPLHWRKPRRIFVNSMSDLFHESVQDAFIAQVWAVMDACPQHTFQILTKRPARMRDWCQRVDSGCEALARDFLGVADPTGRDHEYNNYPLPNVWLGVSVEDQATADERVPLLLQTPAAVRWISAEPLLGKIDIDRWLEFVIDPPNCLDSTHPVDWVVVGGESGPHARPMHPDWVRSLRDQCGSAGVKFFFKQWGEWAPANPVAGLDAPNRSWVNLDDEHSMWRIGKKKAGRLLDGKLHDEYPA